MCCFSRPVQRVARTRIFARPTYAGRQVVVYAMELTAAESLAMILPVPVKAGSDPKEFRFINLEAYPEFFDDLSRGFPELANPASAGAGSSPTRAATAKLEVVNVGSVAASFVPTLSDFQRLDARFRIDPKIWRKLPGYERMGFAVFKLKAGRQQVHPMCFAFPRADGAKLFFPTLHIHDGTIRETENFDHELYAQGNGEQAPDVLNWEESRGWAGQFMKTERTAGILHRDAHVYRRKLRGKLPNEDTYVALG
jgi:hypothetical protein